MYALIDEVRRRGDSVGGVVECIARGVPAGLGEPVFDKLEADLAKALISLPAAKGFEIGSGFAGTALTGSEHNDPFTTDAKGRTRTTSNRSGGIQGGISNGEAILLRVAFKPTATVRVAQQTVDRAGKPVVLEAGGRHDPCVLPRAVPMVEAMVCLTLADHWLRQRAGTRRRSLSRTARSRSGSGLRSPAARCARCACLSRSARCALGLRPSLACGSLRALRACLSRLRSLRARAPAFARLRLAARASRLPEPHRPLMAAARSRRRQPPPRRAGKHARQRVCIEGAAAAVLQAAAEQGDGEEGGGSRPRKAWKVPKGGRVPGATP